MPSGGVLLVSNHSGQIPLDGMILGAAMFLDTEPPRIVRSMVEKWTQTLPFISTMFSRVGQVVGVPENARRLLDLGEAILVFPEGARGSPRPSPIATSSASSASASCAWRWRRARRSCPSR